jgi:hypothetical protein
MGDELHDPTLPAALMALLRLNILHFPGASCPCHGVPADGKAAASLGISIFPTHLCLSLPQGLRVGELKVVHRDKPAAASGWRRLPDIHFFKEAPCNHCDH